MTDIEKMDLRSMDIVEEKREKLIGMSLRSGFMCLFTTRGSGCHVYVLRREI